MPYEMRYIAKVILKLAHKQELKPSKIQTVLSDLIFLRYFNPPITSPEVFSIVPDSALTPIARYNLTMISKILLSVARGTPYDDSKAFSDFVKRVKIKEYFEALACVNQPDQSFVDGVDSYYGCVRAIVISHNELNFLHKLMLSVPEEVIEKVEGRRESDLKAILNELEGLKPDIPLHTDNFFFLPVGSENVDLPLHNELFETQVFPIKKPVRQNMDSEEFELLDETAKSLAKVLVLIPSLESFLHRPLADILKSSQQMIPSDKGDYAVTLMIVNKTITALNRLPQRLKQHDFSPIVDHLEQVLSGKCAKWNYAHSLFEEKRGLLMSIQNLNSLIDDLEIEKYRFMDYLIAVKLRTFREDYENQIDKFVVSFASLPTKEEKRNYLLQNLYFISSSIRRSKLFRFAENQEITSACQEMERYLLRLVYDYAFLATEEEVEETSKFRLAVGKVQDMGASAPVFGLNPRCSKWLQNVNNYNLALLELNRIDTVHTPQISFLFVFLFKSFVVRIEKSCLVSVV